MDGRPLSTLSKEVSFTSPARSDPDTALADVGDSAKDNYRPAGNGTQCCCCEIVTTFPLLSPILTLISEACSDLRTRSEV